MADVKVYFIVNLKINDAETYRKYEKGFFPILKKHGGEFITFDDNIEHFEGDNPMRGRVILFSFPSIKNAKEWYADPEYQSLSEYRRKSVTTTLTMVNGLAPR